MEDILSPTHSFLDFNFSEFIDKNFDMSNDIFNSPNNDTSLLSANSHAFLSSADESSDSGSTKLLNTENYTHQSPCSLDLGPLWSNIEELACVTTTMTMDKTPHHADEPPSLSCIDDFIKDPYSDLVQLVEQCDNERSLFQNLITHSLNEQHVSSSVTPYQVLQQQMLLQQQRLLYQQQFLELHHSRQNFAPQLPPTQPLQHSLDQQHQSPLPQQKQKKRKNYSASTQQQNKRVSKSNSYSSSNNSNYTHSDSVNAQLLRELIRQAGRNNKTMRMDSNCSTTSTNKKSSNLVFPPADYSRPLGKESSYYHMPTTTNGNYCHSYYVPPLSTSSSTTSSSSPSSSHQSRPNLPYHIQTSNNKKVSTTKSTKNMMMMPSRNKHGNRPSMYSSDISQAQLLEIQAISRAQQDFIRAREQQEAEKGIMLKQHQKKKKQHRI